jgi:hypothetical protein
MTADGMEAHILALFPDREPCQQAKDFAELALAHYNKKKTVCTTYQLLVVSISCIVLFLSQHHCHEPILPRKTK